MDTLSTVILALLTIISPLGISIAKNEAWTKTAKVAVPILISAALAILYLYITGGITQGMGVIPVILAVYGGQQLAYTTIMRWWSTILEQRGQEAPVESEDDEPKHLA